MKSVLQVVKKASLRINGELYSQIDKGYLVLVGFNSEDNENDIHLLMDKLLSLRLFQDESGKTNLSLSDVGGQIMIVSQFTLYADVKKGRRPSFTSAAKSEISKPLYDKTIEYVSKFMDVKTGVFGADMQIELINDGPFTLVLDSKDLKK